MQQNLSDFMTNADESTETDSWTPAFGEYGPTMDRLLPDAELAAMFESGETVVDRREIPDSGLSLSDITDWPFSHVARITPPEREHFEEMMDKLNPNQDDGRQNSHSDTGRLLAILETIEERETGSYVPGQGTALDTVNAIRRTADLRPVAEWTIPEIEATLYNLGHLFDALEVRTDDPGPNCKQLSRLAEALHQDLIDELQEREHFDDDTRQYLTHQFGSVCSKIEYANTPGYCAGNHFEEIHRITDISDRITALFDDSGDAPNDTEPTGQAAAKAIAAGEATDDDQDDQDDDDARSTPRAVADGGVVAADFDSLDELGRGTVLALDKLEGEHLVVDRKEVPLGTIQSIDVVDEDGRELRLKVVALGGERYFDVLDGHEPTVLKSTANIDAIRAFEVVRRDQQWLEEYLAETIPQFSP